MTAYRLPPTDLKLHLRDRLLWDSIQIFEMRDAVPSWLPVSVILAELLKMRQWARYQNESSGRTFTAHTLVEFLRDMEVGAVRQRARHDMKMHHGYFYRDLIECWKSWDFTVD